jgi:thiamine biosynthesis protein ThiS
MNIFVNGTSAEVESEISLEQLLIDKKLVEQFIAVAVNKMAIPSTDYNLLKLSENDQIEILKPMSGG